MKMIVSLEFFQIFTRIFFQTIIFFHTLARPGACPHMDPIWVYVILTLKRVLAMVNYFEERLE